MTSNPPPPPYDYEANGLTPSRLSILVERKESGVRKVGKGVIITSTKKLSLLKKDTLS
jgi:hypothetical protein